MVVGVCAKASSLLSHAHEQPASLHRTVFERRSERETAGRVTRALWEEMEKTGGGLALEDGGQPPQSAIVEAGRDLARANMAMAAGAGGLTSYLSLAPGTERVLNRHRSPTVKIE